MNSTFLNNRFDIYQIKSDTSNIQTQSIQGMSSRQQKNQQQFNQYSNESSKIKFGKAGKSKIIMTEVRSVSAAISRNEKTLDNSIILKYENNSKRQNHQYQKQNQVQSNQSQFHPSLQNTYYENGDQDQKLQQKLKYQLYNQSQSRQESPLLQQGNFNNLTHQNSQYSQSSKNELPQSTSELEMEMKTLKQEIQSLKKELEQHKQIQAQRDFQYRNKFEDFENFMKMSQQNIRVESDYQQQQKSEIKQELELYVSNILQSQQKQLKHYIKQHDEQNIQRQESINYQVQQIKSNFQMLPQYSLLDDKIEQIKKQNNIQYGMFQQNIQKLDQTIQNEQSNINIIKGQISTLQQANQPILQKSKNLLKQELNSQQDPVQASLIANFPYNSKSVDSSQNLIQGNNFQLIQYQCYKCFIGIYDNTVMLDCFHTFHEDCLKELISQQLNNKEQFACNCGRFIKFQTLQQLLDQQEIINIRQMQTNLLKNQLKCCECYKCGFFWINPEQKSVSKCSQCT